MQTPPPHLVGVVAVPDPEADMWSPRARLPRAGCTAAAAVGDAVYVFVMGQRVLQYHPLTDSYVPTRRSSPHRDCNEGFSSRIRPSCLVAVKGAPNHHTPNAIHSKINESTVMDLRL